MSAKYEYRIVEEKPGEFRAQWRRKTHRIFDWIGFTRPWNTQQITASADEAQAVIDDQRLRRMVAVEREKFLKGYPKVIKYPA